MDRLETLVVRAQLGESEAQDLLVRRFERMALSYAYSILGDYDLAEDARQEAFISAYLDLMTLREPAAFPAWLRRIVHKQSVRLIRGRGVLLAPVEELQEVGARDLNTGQAAEQHETGRLVRKAIDQLPENERETTRLFYLEGQSIKEIAGLLGLPASTVKSRLHAARACLRQMLMKVVKGMMSQPNPQTRRKAKEAATTEAVAHLERRIQSLVAVPSEQDQREAGELLCAMGRLQRFLGRMEEALATFENGLKIPAMKKDPQWRVRLRAEIGMTHAHTADYATAQKVLRRCKAAVGASDADSTLHAAVLNSLGLCAWGQGAYGRARGLYEQSAAISRRAGCEELEAEALNNLALLAWKAGRLEEALAGFQGVLRAWRKIRNRYANALTLMNIGVIEENLGRWAAARRHYMQALRLAEQLDYLQVQAATCANLGNLALNDRDWGRAMELNQKGLELARRNRDRRGQAIALENLALAHLGAKQWAQSRRMLQRARKLASEIGDREREISLDLLTVEARLSQNNIEGIINQIEQAQAVITRRGYRSELPRCLRLRAWAECLTGGETRAKQTMARALRECRKQKNRAEEKSIHRLSRELKL